MVVAVGVARFAPFSGPEKLQTIPHGRLFTGIAFLAGPCFLKYRELPNGVAAQVTRGAPLVFTPLLRSLRFSLQLGR